MSNGNSIHYLALERAKARLSVVEQEFLVAKQERDEALSFGDVSENEELQSVKMRLGRLAREREILAPITTMIAVRTNDAIAIVDEGAVVEVIIHAITGTPVAVGTPEFKALKEKEPAFRGHLMYGRVPNSYSLVDDCALSETSPIGKFIMGKQPGDYSVPVPAGFANISIQKIRNVQSTEDLFWEV